MNTIDIEPIKTDYRALFIKHFDCIKDEKIREFANNIVNDVPKYFFEVAASSSGKYHPACDLGEGGLVRHSINVMKMLNFLMEPEQCKFTDHEKDLLRVAALFHDSFKSGTQAEYEKSNHTKMEHPIVSAIFIIGTSLKYGFLYEDAKFIADAIESHMGQWNTSGYSKCVLPKPTSVFQQTLHMADYLASRKEINMSIDTSGCFLCFLPREEIKLVTE